MASVVIPGMDTIATILLWLLLSGLVTGQLLSAFTLRSLYRRVGQLEARLSTPKSARPQPTPRQIPRP